VSAADISLLDSTVLTAELPLAGDGWRRKEDLKKKFEHTVKSAGITASARCNVDQHDTHNARSKIERGTFA
jgi:hypothetical protein